MTSGFYEQLGVEADASAGQLRAAYGRAVAKLVRRRKAIVEQGGDTAPIDLSRAQLDEAWAVLSDPVRRRRYDAMLAWTSGGHAPNAEALWEEVRDALVHPAAAVAAKLLRVTTNLQQIGQMPLAPSSSEDEPPTLVPHDDDLTAPRVSPRQLRPSPFSTEGPTEGAPTPQPAGRAQPAARAGAPVVELPSQRIPAVRPAGAVDPSLRVVDGTPGASSVLVLPSDRHDGAGRDALGGAGAAASSAPTPAGADPGTSRIGRPRPLSPEEITALVDGHGYSGALLRGVREARGLPLQDVADTTRISVRYLEAIEADRFTDLPSATFVRGYVREMARMLGLDAEAVVAGYMRRMGG